MRRHLGRIMGATVVAALVGLAGGMPLVGVRASATPTVELGDITNSAPTWVRFSFATTSAISGSPSVRIARPTNYTFPTATIGANLLDVVVRGTKQVGVTAAMSASGIVIDLGGNVLSAVGSVVITIDQGAGITNPASGVGTTNWTWTTNRPNNQVEDSFSVSTVTQGSSSSSSSSSTSTTTTVAATTTTVAATTTTAAATTTTAAATTTTAAPALTKAIEADPRATAGKELTDIVKLDLAPTDDSSKIGGSVGLRPGPTDPALQLIAIYTRTIQLESGSSTSWVKKSSTAVPETNVTASFTGSDYNKPEVWAAEGFGESCWKIDWTTSQYLYSLPSPSVTSGRNLAGWTYTNVIVKAGSITDPSLQMNTIFKSPAVGSGVFADVNRTGVLEQGGKGGDKEISHVVFCGTSNSGSSSTTVAGNQASTTSTAATTTLAPTTTTRATTTTTTRATTTTTAGGRQTSTTTRQTTTTTTVPGSKDPILVNMTAEPKVTLCHRTSSRTNPYVSITVDASAVLKEGHGSHTGPIFPADNWGDIIPAFGDYPGLNWPEGKGIVDAGCDTDRIVDTFVRDGKVTLCHATASRTNPYVTITVDANSVTRRGHDGHTGPVFPADGWGDIIPPFGTYPGLNWPAGQTILAAGCDAGLLDLAGSESSTTTVRGTPTTVGQNTVTTTTTARGRATTTTAPRGDTTTTVRGTPSTVAQNAATTTTVARRPTTTPAPGVVTTTPPTRATTTTAPNRVPTTTSPRVTTTAPNRVTTTAPSGTVAQNVATTIPRATSTTVAVTTTTMTVPEGEWNPSLTSMDSGGVSAATLRRREQCAASSTFDATITEVQMLLSRGTSQEVVSFEVCMNSFTVTAANAPLEAFGDAVTVDPAEADAAALASSAGSIPTVGNELDLVWIAVLCMTFGLALLGGMRRFDDQ